MIKETVVRNGNLRAEFFRNIWMVEKARKNFDEDEIEILRKIYAEGKEDGEFDIDNVDLVADITHYCIKGLGGTIHLWPIGTWHECGVKQTFGCQGGLWCLG